jgi:hypothetical protein
MISNDEQRAAMMNEEQQRVTTGNDVQQQAIAINDGQQTVTMSNDEKHRATADNDGRAMSMSPAALSALRRFARPRPAGERCDLCAAAIAGEHEHLYDPRRRAVECACAACALLFADGTQRKRVPHVAVRIDDFQLDASAWRALGLPIDVAFFTVDEAGAASAFYPGPAGAVTAAVSPDSWRAMLAANPTLRLASDVEALLIRRRSVNIVGYRVSLDECYRLTGLLRASWHGFHGGAEAWSTLDQFFATLDGGAACRG